MRYIDWKNEVMQYLYNVYGIENVKGHAITQAYTRHRKDPIAAGEYIYRFFS